MRKKMYRNDMFYVHYPYDSKLARLVREVSNCPRWGTAHINRTRVLIVPLLVKKAVLAHPMELNLKRF